jgi:pSer/pThr/pTyr-binding forkhead associated (FHA) protein
MALLEVFRPEERELITLEAPPPEERGFSDFIIGRSPEVWLRLDDGEQNVSRLHAKLSPVAGRWAIEDLGSRNGTWVNGDRLARVRILWNDDQIRFATFMVVFRDPTEPEAAVKARTVTPDLSLRERKVLVELCRPFFGANLLLRAASRSEIARAMVTGETAVQEHLVRLYDKLLIDDAGENRCDLLAVAVIEAGIVGPGDYDERPTGK